MIFMDVVHYDTGRVVPNPVTKTKEKPYKAHETQLIFVRRATEGYVDLNS
jgi:hypothetical protein